MTKDSKYFLLHILECIERIKEYTFGFNQEDFLTNKLVQDAVIRNFEIIGEATKKLDTEFREQNPSIEWKRIAGMRDKLIHDYLGVDLFAVWRVIEIDLPDLELKINQILKESNTWTLAPWP